MRGHVVMPHPVQLLALAPQVVIKEREDRSPVAF